MIRDYLTFAPRRKHFLFLFSSLTSIPGTVFRSHLCIFSAKGLICGVPLAFFLTAGLPFLQFIFVDLITNSFLSPFSLKLSFSFIPLNYSYIRLFPKFDVRHSRLIWTAFATIISTPYGQYFSLSTFISGYTFTLRFTRYPLDLSLTCFYDLLFPRSHVEHMGTLPLSIKLHFVSLCSLEVIFIK